MQADYGGIRRKEVRENVCTYTRYTEPTNTMEHSPSSQAESFMETEDS
jgi:hypothetical protein